MGNNKEIKELNVKGTRIKYVNKGFDRYIPYVEFMKAFFGNRYLVMMRKFKGELNLIDIDGLKYLPIFQLRYIFKESNEEEEKHKIILQIFEVRKIKKEKIDKKIIEAFGTLNSVFSIYQEKYDSIHQYNLQECDLKHFIENETFNQSKALETIQKFKKMRKERRNTKNLMEILNVVMKFLEDKKINQKELQNIFKNISEIKTKQELAEKNKIYFKRDLSNEKEMEEKLKKLQEFFK